MLDRPSTYRSYILTLWQEHSRGSREPAVWRFRLEDPRTGRRSGFADLAALVAALEEVMGHDRTLGEDAADQSAAGP
ncbi:MAG TPA: hypothetical protein PKO09_08550 [Anaerolineae bacterium]|nr:hypothetical protein [Anaerolineae bacterium]